MQWQDEAIILSARKFGEGSAIVTLLASEHGVCSGMVRSVSGKKNRAIYQVGNKVDVTWRGRLAEQLGGFSAEVVKAYSSLVLQNNIQLMALCSACYLVEKCLPEREPHPHMYQLLLQLLHAIAHDENWLPFYVQFELELLQELGFGLDLSECAATGELEELVYVSPKSGRAVSKAAGEPYRTKMLALPPFLLENEENDAITMLEIKNGLALTGYFLNKYVYMPHGWELPDVRARLATAIEEK